MIAIIIFLFLLEIRQAEIEKKLLYKMLVIPISLEIIAMIFFIDGMVDGYLPTYEYNGFYPAIGFYIVVSASIYGLSFALMTLVFNKQIVRHVKEKHSLTDEGARLLANHTYTKRQKEEIIENYKRR